MDRQKSGLTATRKKLLKPVRRVVIKAGSGILTSKNGLNRKVITNLTTDICFLKSKGIEVILISSGAIASGLKKIGLSKRPESLSQQQAVAAVGQSSLMMAYEKSFGRFDQKVAQILITRDDLNNRRRYLNARNTILTLLSWKILPIINENDTVVADELKFGDNDNLSSMVTNLTEAQLLISLTDIDGLYNKDPRTNKDASLISTVDNVDREILKYASTIPGFLGTGGMASKIKAARKANLRGVPVVIANGRKEGIIGDIFKGEEVGTLFRPQDITLSSREHWIVFTKAPKGQLVVDSGACDALIKRGKSLLPSGIKDVTGRFSRGDSVVILDENNRELAKGMVNYTSGAISLIKGLKSNEIEGRLGYKQDDEVIHRDNLVLTFSMEGAHGS